MWKPHPSNMQYMGAPLAQGKWYQTFFFLSRIRETPTLSTDADSMTDTILRGYVKGKKKWRHFFVGGGPKKINVGDVNFLL